MRVHVDQDRGIFGMTAGLIRLGDRRRKDLPTRLIYEQANRRVFKQSVHLKLLLLCQFQKTQPTRPHLTSLSQLRRAKPLTGSCVVIRPLVYMDSHG